MQDYTQLYQSILAFWNDFAAKNGYPLCEKTNDKIRHIVKRRLRAEKDLFQRLPTYFELIHRYCDGRDEFGKPLDLHAFFRTTALLRALREHERQTGESLLNSSL